MNDPLNATNLIDQAEQAMIRRESAQRAAMLQESQSVMAMIENAAQNHLDMPNHLGARTAHLSLAGVQGTTAHQQKYPPIPETIPILAAGPLSQSPISIPQSPLQVIGEMLEQTQSPPHYFGPMIEQVQVLPGTISPIGMPFKTANYLADTALNSAGSGPGWFANITLGGEKVVSPDGPITVHGEITVEPNCLPCYYDGLITVIRNFEVVYTGNIPTQETAGGPIDWDILRELGYRDLQPGDEILVTINFYCTGSGKDCPNSTATYSIFVGYPPLLLGSPLFLGPRGATDPISLLNSTHCGCSIKFTSAPDGGGGVIGSIVFSTSGQCIKCFTTVIARNLSIKPPAAKEVPSTVVSEGNATFGIPKGFMQGALPGNRILVTACVYRFDYYGRPCISCATRTITLP